MKNHEIFSRSLCAAAILLLVLPSFGDAATLKPMEQRSAAPDNVAAAIRLRAGHVSGQLPLVFEANGGQTDSEVKFLARRPGSTVFLTSKEAVVVVTRRDPSELTRSIVRMTLVGADSHGDVTGLEQLPGKVNYFIGKDPTKWRTAISTYGKVQRKNIYSGIDVVYYGNHGRLEYDFVVRPGGDPKQIRLAFQGADKLEVDAQGDLLIHTSAGTIRQPTPVIFQEVGGVRREIVGRHVLEGPRAVSFHVAAYDVGLPLVIDPVLLYSTFLGGTADDALGAGIAVDAAGNAYVAGGTLSADFPTTAGTFQTTASESSDAFVTKLNATGSALIYSTYVGGNGSEYVVGLFVDSAGTAYVAGTTDSTDFPTTVGALQRTNPNGSMPFVTKLNPSGSALVYSTYVGFGADQNRALTVDAAGNAYITGVAGTPNFPTTPGAFQSTFSGNPGRTFVTKLNPTGTGLVYSTFLTGSGPDVSSGIAVDAAGSAYVVGATQSADFPTTPGAFQTASSAAGPGTQAGFIAKLNATGSALVYASYLSGSGGGSTDRIAVDAAGNAYVGGGTCSADFPTTAGAFQRTLNGCGAYVTKLDPAASALLYSTYLAADNISGLALDAAGNAYVTGRASRFDFRTTAGALQPTLGGGDDGFVLTLDPAGSGLLYSTYLGGSTEDAALAIAVDGSSNAYVMGVTASPEFPTTTAAFQTAFHGVSDAFILKISPNTAAGTSVSVPAGHGVTVTFNTVSSPGQTSATTSTTGATPPPGFSLGGSSYYSITTTASFTSSVTICITFDPTQFNDPTTLQLFHFENNTWGPLLRTSIDPIGGVICAQTNSLSPFLVAERTPIPVTIAIKPMAAAPVPVNLGSSVVPVAILGSSTLDASTVDPSTVTLASAPVKLKGNGSPTASLQDVNGDRVADLVVQVQTSALQLSSSSTTAVLKGRTFSGLPIKGSEAIVVVPQ
jgi:Beta-propeller repeat